MDITDRTYWLHLFEYYVKDWISGLSVFGLWVVFDAVGVVAALHVAMA